MIASPMADAMIRVLAVSQRVHPAGPLQVIAREVRMADADLRALLVEFDNAPDDATRILVRQRRNHTMRGLAVLMHAMVEALEECTK